MRIGSGPGRRKARISAQLSLRLEARLADDFPPFRYFRPEAGGAFLGRAGDRLVTERRQAFPARPAGLWLVQCPAAAAR